jgi:hypothetical protein
MATLFQVEKKMDSNVTVHMYMFWGGNGDSNRMDWYITV